MKRFVIPILIVSISCLSCSKPPSSAQTDWQTEGQPTPGQGRSASATVAPTRLATAPAQTAEPIVKEVVPFSLRRLLQESKEPGMWLPPQQAELKRFENLVVQTLAAGEQWPSLTRRWNAEGWNVHSNDERDIVVIVEQPGLRRGRGAFAFRPLSDSRVTLEAPHRFFDLKTGMITRKLFLEQDVRAAAWNTIHRDQVDVAHTGQHFMNAFTRAMIGVNNQMSVIQIHGFAGTKKRGAAGDAKVIVSDTTRFPGRLARTASISLKEMLAFDEVLLFPIEVNELGGTTNAQAKAAHGLGSPLFLHLEMNAEFRQQLAKSASVRDSFYKAVVGAPAQ